EAVARDADDGHRDVVDEDRFVEDVGIAGEAATPIVVAENGEWVAAGIFFVGGTEDAADGRHDAEDVEIISGDELETAALGLPLRGEAGVGGRARDEADHV